MEEKVAKKEEKLETSAESQLQKHEAIPHHVPSTSRRTFLEFGVDGESIGRVVISLIDEGNWTENFHILCMGRDQGSSYRHSNILRVYSKGTESEFIRLGDYERNNGIGGRAVVPGVNWRKERERDIYKRTRTKAGFVLGRIDESGATVSQFAIFTVDHDSGYTDPFFGKVEEGLHIIRDIIDRYDNANIRKVKIMDCGVILSTHGELR